MPSNKTFPTDALAMASHPGAHCKYLLQTSFATIILIKKVMQCHEFDFNQAALFSFASIRQLIKTSLPFT